MSSIINFPAKLPSSPHVSGYKYTSGTSVVRSQMNIKPDKVRRQQSRAIDKYECSYVLDDEQKTILERFYKKDLCSGSKYFNWRGICVRLDMPNGVTFENIEHSSLWRVHLSMEVEP